MLMFQYHTGSIKAAHIDHWRDGSLHKVPYPTPILLLPVKKSDIYQQRYFRVVGLPRGTGLPGTDDGFR